MNWLSSIFGMNVNKLKNLERDSKRKMASRLAQENRWSLLVDWLLEEKYYGIIYEVLRKSNNADAASLLIALLRSDSSEVRTRAIEALGPLGGDAAVAIISDLALKASGEELKEIVRALGRFSWAGAIPVLTRLLNGYGDYWDQIERAEALARCGGQLGIDFLREQFVATGEGDYLLALIKLDKPDAIPLSKTFLLKWPHGTQSDIVREYLRRNGL